MIKSSKFLVLLLALMVALAFPVLAFADKEKDEDKGKSDSRIEQMEFDEEDSDQEEDLDDEDKDDEDLDEEESDKEEDEMNEEEFKEWEAIKDQIEAEKDAIESSKDALEDQKDNLEKQYEAAKESGDTALMESLMVELEATRSQIDDYKNQMKAKKEAMKEVIRNRYTAEEWSKLQASIDELEQVPGITVLPVENVFLSGGIIEFDTPPVLKEGRALIPVRAVSEAVGAVVSWSEEDNLATIVKDDITIEFDIDSGTVYLNGEEAEIDVPAEILNARVIVPLRFIGENMGLNVNWDEENSIIEITE